MNGITLILDGYDVHDILSTYSTQEEITYPRVITTLDNKEHPAPGVIRSIVEFSFTPLTDEKASEVYAKLKNLLLSVQYTNMDTGQEETKTMRITSNISSQFLLKSITGKRYYRGGTIQMRAL
jgi:hypothetical protein